jgi:hypothetical protein
MSKAGAGQLVELLQRVAFGGLCGVGLLWALTTLLPAAKGVVLQCGRELQRFSGHYPVATLGLLLGIIAALVWTAVKK